MCWDKVAYIIPIENWRCRLKCESKSSHLKHFFQQSIFLHCVDFNYIDSWLPMLPISPYFVLLLSLNRHDYDVRDTPLDFQGGRKFCQGDFFSSVNGGGFFFSSPSRGWFFSLKISKKSFPWRQWWFFFRPLTGVIFFSIPMALVMGFFFLQKTSYPL